MHDTPFIDWSVFSQFGIAGLILGVFFTLLLLILRIHARTIKGVVDRLSADNKQSSETWRETIERIENRYDKRQVESNIVLRELTNALHGGSFCHGKSGNNPTRHS